MVSLYRAAVEALREGDVELARRLTREAEEVRRATRLRKPRFLRFGVCRNCGAPLVPGLSARVRLHPEGKITRVSVTCLVCGYVFRMHVRRRRP
jgi:ribonuclease P protein subunit RPR2